MRTLFIALLIVNITLVAYEKFDIRTNPADIKPEAFPEKIKLISQDEVNNRSKPVSVAAVAPTSSTVSPVPTCLEWSNFAENDLARAEKLLDPLQLGDRIKKRQHTVMVGYWVHIPPLKNKTDAEKKGRELEKMNVTDYFLIQDNSDSNNAISLGVFKTEEAANNYLTQLREKGVRSARVGIRHQTLTSLIIEDLVPTITPRLMELQKEIPTSEMKPAECKAPEKTS